MLTSDLVSYSKSGRYIKPCFISSSDPELNKIAGELLDICRLAAQKRICRRDFQDMVMPLRELDSKKKSGERTFEAAGGEDGLNFRA